MEPLTTWLAAGRIKIGICLGAKREASKSGEQITNLDDLQDIDELHVVEGKATTTASSAFSIEHPPGNGHAGPSDNGQSGPSTAQSQSTRADSGASASTSQSTPFASPPAQSSKRGVPPAAPLAQTALSDRHRMTTGELDPQGLGGEADTEPDQDNKYVKRTGSVRRSLQRVMPAIFQPTLPVTTRDVKGGKAGSSSAQPARRRRRRQQICSLRNLLVLFALIGTLGTMLFLYSKVQPTAL
ncbi:TPA: hypothetical protein ACH3X3_006635 [Trebouxia sp. C0006]